MERERIQLSFIPGRDQGSKNVTFGVPWAKQACGAADAFNLLDASGQAYPVQTTTSATWPDGSVKWTRHSANLNGAAQSAFELVRASGHGADTPALAAMTDDAITVDTGCIRAVFGRSGTNLIRSAQQNGHTVCAGATAIAQVERRSGLSATILPLTGAVESAEIEENGPVRCVVKLSGRHQGDGGVSLFPFIIRFTLYRDSAEIRVTHTFLYDGDAHTDFLRGLGLRFSLPLEDAAYNRHVKLGGDAGFFHEPLQQMTAWRPRLDPSLYTSQMAGNALRFDSGTADGQNALTALEDITLWDSYKLTQDSSEHYVMQKRTQSDACAFINAAHGRRSCGVAYAGCHAAGLAVGLRDFWQKYPSALWIEGAAGDAADITAWLWTPDAPAADLRHYDTRAHASAFYEGFDEVRSTPYGIANTNELVLLGFTGHIAENSELALLVQTVQKPAVMTPTPAYMHRVRAFGIWSLPHTRTAQGRWFEAQLDQAIAYYKNEVEQRKWFGFFDYGDVMHTYDAVRHMWRYDMGGYAWQNTELVPTLWLWLAFLRTGREDIFTLAEAMCRHTAEVDSYHLGEYKGLGSRHNVVHWGCACKEARIAMAGHHRYYYYLTGDMRTGDVLDDVTGAEYAVGRLDPLRTYYPDAKRTHARTGPDWSSLCANWLTAWERHGNLACRDKLLQGVADIKQSPLRLISGSDYEFEPETGHMIYIGENSGGGSHLAICMGAPQIWMEMADVIGDPEWNAMLSEYGAFYLLPPEEKHKRSGGLLPGDGFSFPYMAAAMAAYYAQDKGDDAYARQVWIILKDAWTELDFETRQIPAPFSAFTQTEVPRVSTNFMAQWCLNVIMCLDLIDDQLDS